MKKHITSLFVFVLMAFCLFIGCDPENEVITTDCLECPSVSGVFPTEAYEGDTIKVMGTKFSGLEKVTVNDVDAFILAGSTNQEISIVAPPQVGNIEEVEINVIKKINSFVVNSSKKGKFKYLTPTINTFLPNRAFNGDTIEVLGKKLIKINNITFNDQVAITFFKNERLFLIVPALASISTVQIKANLANSKPATISPEAVFTYESQFIERFYPKEGTSNTSVTIYGKFQNSMQAPTVKLGSVLCVVKNYTRDSINITIPFGSPSGKFTVISNNLELKNDEKFYYFPKTLKAYFLKALPNQTKVITSFASFLKSNKTKLFVVIYESECACHNYFVYSKSLAQGVPGNLLLTLVKSLELSTKDSETHWVYSFAVNNNFSYLIKGVYSFFGPPSTVLPTLTTIDPAHLVRDRIHKLNESANFDALSDNSMIIGPTSKGLMQKGSGVKIVKETPLTLYKHSSSNSAAGTASALDSTVFMSSGKLYSISNDLNSAEKLIFDNTDNFTIKNIALNKTKDLDQIYFQDGKMQRIVLYNVKTKTHKTFPITGDGVDFDLITMDEDNVLFGLNSKGLFKIAEQ